jgi:hypothetical protein
MAGLTRAAGGDEVVGGRQRYALTSPALHSFFCVAVPSRCCELPTLRKGLQSNLPEKIQGPTNRIPDHIGHQPSIQCGVAAFVLHNFAQNPEGIAPL